MTTVSNSSFFSGFPFCFLLIRALYLRFRVQSFSLCFSLAFYVRNSLFSFPLKLSTPFSIDVIVQVVVGTLYFL
jgi:hypothetical protein